MPDADSELVRSGHRKPEHYSDEQSAAEFAVSIPMVKCRINATGVDTHLTREKASRRHIADISRSEAVATSTSIRPDAISGTEDSSTGMGSIVSTVMSPS